jgi:hypothetical protein
MHFFGHLTVGFLRIKPTNCLFFFFSLIIYFLLNLDFLFMSVFKL